MARASLALAPAAAGSRVEAMSTADGLIEAAAATGNPAALSLALLAHGFVFREADPPRALAALRRGLIIAHDNGQRTYETSMLASLARLEALHGDAVAAFDYLTQALRNYHDSGNTVQMRAGVAILAVLLDRLGRYESAATIAGVAPHNRMTANAMPELDAAITHLRKVLGDETYESLAAQGRKLTTAAIATYAYDQIDQARIELNAVSE